MSAPNLIAFYSPLSVDPILSQRSIHTRGVYESGSSEPDCDWNDPRTGPDWQAAESGPDWQAAESGPDWHTSEAGPDWQDAEPSTGWFDDKDCD